MEIKQRYIINVFATRSLAVAIINYNTKTGELLDWAVYINSVPGKGHTLEYEEVGKIGDKQASQTAHFLFPNLNIKKYRN